VRDALSLSWRRDPAISIPAIAKSSHLNAARAPQRRVAAGPVPIMGSRSLLGSARLDIEVSVASPRVTLGRSVNADVSLMTLRYRQTPELPT
jgi:hypothetical protein